MISSSFIPLERFSTTNFKKNCNSPDLNHTLTDDFHTFQPESHVISFADEENSFDQSQIQKPNLAASSSTSSLVITEHSTFDISNSQISYPSYYSDTEENILNIKSSSIEDNDYEQNISKHQLHSSTGFNNSHRYHNNTEWQQFSSRAYTSNQTCKRFLNPNFDNEAQFHLSNGTTPPPHFEYVGYSPSTQQSHAYAQYQYLSAYHESLKMHFAREAAICQNLTCDDAECVCGLPKFSPSMSSVETNHWSNCWKDDGESLEIGKLPSGRRESGLREPKKVKCCEQNRLCEFCSVSKSVEWRRGPSGPKT
ncbi:hypothetical protein HK096_003522, partial [Nowakowskiella sp. JEL0078]